MTSNDFHPDLQRVARVVPSRGLLTARTVRPNRLLARISRLGGARGQAAPLPTGAVVRVHRPPTIAAPSAALLWIHGGCYLVGPTQQDDKLCERFATELGVVVACVEYRLAPEHPYPAALDDCVAAFNWLVRQHDIDSSRIAIAGGSAGGGLAAALALRLRRETSLQPAIQLLAYPMLDDRRAFERDPNAKQRRFMDQGMNRLGWQSYLRGADPDEAVPARAATLAGLPQAWIGVGTRDLLLDECSAYADRLREDGVKCILEVVPGVFHNFDMFAGAGVSREFFKDQCAALRQALAPN